MIPFIGNVHKRRIYRDGETISSCLGWEAETVTVKEILLGGMTSSETDL